MSNKIIHGLWIGEGLSLLEQLTLRSFVSAGHEFHLWVYDDLTAEIPAGVKLQDANQVIERKNVFRYKHKNQYGHGMGSVSGFSDIFRYKLLYEKGGWWSDMDITCLKYLDIEEPYFFRGHHELLAVGNLMKTPKKSQLMKNAYERALIEVNENNRDWHRPIEILNDQIEQLGLQKYVRHSVTNRDWWSDIEELLKYPLKLPETWLAIHWMNEEWRSRKVSKHQFKMYSTFHTLLVKHGLSPDLSISQKIQFQIQKLSILISKLGNQ